MTPLPPEIHKKCIEITIKLRSFPISIHFNHPVDLSKKEHRQYLNKIRNPQDLGTILSRLEANEYQSITQWEQDINTVWSNAIRFYGEDSLLAIIALQMERRFNKLKKSLDRITIHGWTKYIYFLRHKLDTMLSEVPSNLTTIASKLKQEPTMIVDKLNSHELSKLIEASKNFLSNEDIQQIFLILLKYEKNLNLNGIDYLTLDVNNLSSQSLHELKHYYQKQCIELGISYPQ